METENGPTVSDLERRSTGIGTGMLLAVVAASVPSAMALLQVAPDVIGIALRLGIQASRRSRLLEAPSALSWSRQIEGVRSLSKELDAFHTSAVNKSAWSRVMQRLSNLHKGRRATPAIVRQLFRAEHHHCQRPALSAAALCRQQCQACPGARCPSTRCLPCSPPRSPSSRCHRRCIGIPAYLSA
jgi:hypothetical protein